MVWLGGSRVLVSCARVLWLLACVVSTARETAAQGARTRIPVGAGGDVTTTIDFEDQTPGAPVTTQYLPGVEFLASPTSFPEGGLIPIIASAGAGQAHSGSQVLDIYRPFAESSTSWAGGGFPTTVSRVSMYVGYFANPGRPGDTARVRLRANGPAHDLLAQAEVTVTEGAGFQTLLEVSVSSPQIAYFVVDTGPEDPDDAIGIDDLSFTYPSSAIPDFGLTSPQSAEVLQGGSVALAVAINRFNGSAGAIDFSVAGLPAGVSGTFAPDPADGSTTLTLTAAPDATRNSGTTITITGTPTIASAGPAPRSATTFLSVGTNFEVGVDAQVLTLASCSTASTTVTVLRNLRFLAPVTLSVPDLPPGVQASFDPPVVDFGEGQALESSVLTLRRTANMLPSPDSITVLGTSQGYPSASASLGLELVIGHSRIHVTDAVGNSVSGAELFSFGAPLGVTDGEGYLEVQPPLFGGAQLVARKRVLESRTHRGNHTEDSNQPWNYRVYHTSLVINDDGSTTPFSVSDPCAVLELQVRPDNALIGLHIVASLNWDASAAELQALQTRIVQSSDLFYDATDGQFFIERIEVADAGIDWEGADCRVNAAHRDSLRAYVDAAEHPGFLTDSFWYNGSWVNTARDDNALVYAHEFGHYVTGMADEYDESNVFNARVRCTAATNMSAVPGFPFGLGGSTASCIMWNIGRGEVGQTDVFTRKLCSSHPLNPHLTSTRQGAMPCWDEVMSYYGSDSRWILKSPSSRSSIPGEIQGSGWSPVTPVPDDTFYPNLCAPRGFHASDAGITAESEVYSSTPWGSLLWHGATQNRAIDGVTGLHVGDEVLFLERAYFGRSGAFIITSDDCTPVTAGNEPISVQLSASAFQLLCTVAPVGHDGVEIRVRPARSYRPEPLAGAPEVLVFSSPSHPPALVPMVFEPRSRTWSGSLDAVPIDWNALIRVRATNLGGETTTNLVRATLTRTNPDQDGDAFSGEGRVHVTLPGGGFPPGSRISIGPSDAFWPELQAGFDVVDGPCSIVLTDSAPLTRAGRVRFQLPSAVASSAIEPETCEIWHLGADRGTWSSLGGTYLRDVEIVSVETQELGTFALVAHRARPEVGPDCTEAVPTLPFLWPPNHRLLEVGIDGVVDATPGAPPPEIQITRVTSNEPTAAKDPRLGDVGPDAFIQGGVVQLRAERDPRGIGRTYRIEFQAIGSDGLEATGVVRICVPHDKGKPCVDDGRVFDATR